MRSRIAIWKQVALSLVLFVGLAIVWQGRDFAYTLLGVADEEQSQDQRAGARPTGGVPVIVDAVSEAADVVEIWAVGTGRASRSVTLYPKASGEIVEILISAGDVVTAGQPILRLGDRQAQLSMSMAEAQLDEARRALARLEELLDRGVSAEATVDTSRTAERTAELEYDQAVEALEDRTVRAPFGGIVGIPLVELGERINESTAILTLDDRESLIVEFEIAEAFLPRLEDGMQVSAITPGFPDRPFDGVIAHIDSRVDPTMRTVLLRATIPNGHDDLRPGMSFAVRLDLPGETYPSIPDLALQWGRSGGYVWRINNGTAEEVLVRAVRRQNGQILVDAELAPGDTIVVEGVQRLRQGRNVSFAEPLGAQSGAEAQ